VDASCKLLGKLADSGLSTSTAAESFFFKEKYLNNTKINTTNNNALDAINPHCQINIL